MLSLGGKPSWAGNLWAKTYVIESDTQESPGEGGLMGTSGKGNEKVGGRRPWTGKQGPGCGLKGVEGLLILLRERWE